MEFPFSKQENGGGRGRRGQRAIAYVLASIIFSVVELFALDFGGLPYGAANVSVLFHCGMHAMLVDVRCRPISERNCTRLASTWTRTGKGPSQRDSSGSCSSGTTPHLRELTQRLASRSSLPSCWIASGRLTHFVVVVVVSIGYSHSRSSSEYS